MPQGSVERGAPTRPTVARLIRTKYPGAYADLSDLELEAAVRRKYPGAYQDLRWTEPPPARAEDFTPEDPFAQFVVRPKDDPFAAFAVRTEPTPARAEDFMPKAPEGSAVGRFASGAWEMLNPIEMVKGIASAVASPIDTAGAIASAHVDQGRRALEMARQGRISEAIGHGGAALLPVIGPAAAQIGERIGSGDVAGGLGAASGLVAGIAGPGAVARNAPASVGLRGPLANRNAAAAEAVEAGRRAGVPIDAATATGNRAIGAVQHMADRSLGGSLVAERAAEAQARGLATRGEQLAAKGHGRPVTAEQAGQGVRQAVTGEIRRHAGEADTAYGKLREIEADPAYSSTVTVMTEGRVPGGGTVAIPTQRQVPLAVDLTKAREALRPLYDDLRRQSELAPAQMMGDKGRALVALDRLMSAPEHAPLSVVDGALSDIKRFARTDTPELRTAGQGAAAQIVDHLEAAVREAAAKAGPEALEALDAGRAATRAKYGAAEVLEGLSKDGVRAFDALTARRDTAIDQLRQVARQAPGELPKIGRAFLDDLLERATKEGGFGHGAAIANDWQRLGLETKRLLFRDPGYVRELDQFFHLARLMAKNSNPSGTAHAMAAAGQGGALLGALVGTIEPLTAVAALVGPAAVSKFLHSAAGVKLLTQGIRIPLGNRAARAAWAGQVSAMAERLGISAAVPATVDGAADDPRATR